MLIRQHKLDDIQFCAQGQTLPCVPGLMLLTASVRRKQHSLRLSQNFPSTPSRCISSIMMMPLSDSVLPLPCRPNKSGNHNERDGGGGKGAETETEIAASTSVSYKQPGCQSLGRYQTSRWQTRHEYNLYLQEVN